MGVGRGRSERFAQVTLEMIRGISAFVAIQAQMHRRWRLELENLWGLAVKSSRAVSNSQGVFARKDCAAGLGPKE